MRHKICKIDGCDNKSRSLGYCQKHYSSFYNHGDAEYKSQHIPCRTLPEYHVWSDMKQRCLNVNHKNYDSYGGRGITVCDRWLHDFKTFFSDMGQRTSDKHSIDRIDNDGGYAPDNCRWATKSVQNSNVRIKNGRKYLYWHKHKQRWYVRENIGGKLVHVGYFVNKDDAINACRL